MVHGNGKREDVSLEHANALGYARAAAQSFGLDPERKIDYQAPPDREVDFDKELARKDAIGESGSARKSKKRAEAA